MTGDTTATILSTESVADAFYRTRFQMPVEPVVKPGQFVQVRPRAEHLSSPYLRMPLSVSAVDRTNSTIDVLYETVGPKTTALQSLSQGDDVAILGPLGNQFPEPEADATPVLVGGGIGVPPLIYFGTQLRASSRAVHLLVGARTAGKHLPDDLLQPATTALGRATDDGSLGHAGVVTELLEKAVQELPNPVVYTCGPHGMMAAVAALCVRHDVSCFASLEEYMACGFGVCVGCVVERADKEGQASAYTHYARVCVDGPVFDARQIVW